MKPKLSPNQEASWRWSRSFLSPRALFRFPLSSELWYQEVTWEWSTGEQCPLGHDTQRELYSLKLSLGSVCNKYAMSIFDGYAVSTHKTFYWELHISGIMGCTTGPQGGSYPSPSISFPMGQVPWSFSIIRHIFQAIHFGKKCLKTVEQSVHIGLFTSRLQRTVYLSIYIS